MTYYTLRDNYSYTSQILSLETNIIHNSCINVENGKKIKLKLQGARLTISVAEVWINDLLPCNTIHSFSGIKLIRYSVIVRIYIYIIIFKLIYALKSITVEIGTLSRI